MVAFRQASSVGESPATAGLRVARMQGWGTRGRRQGLAAGPRGDTVLDQRTSGSLNCGGQRSLVTRFDGIDVNLLNHLGQQLLPVCSS